jgi:hypothetical protein
MVEIRVLYILLDRIQYKPWTQPFVLPLECTILNPSGSPLVRQPTKLVENPRLNDCWSGCYVLWRSVACNLPKSVQNSRAAAYKACAERRSGENKLVWRPRTRAQTVDPLMPLSSCAAPLQLRSCLATLAFDAHLEMFCSGSRSPVAMRIRGGVFFKYGSLIRVLN